MGINVNTRPLVSLILVAAVVQHSAFCFRPAPPTSVRPRENGMLNTPARHHRMSLLNLSGNEDDDGGDRGKTDNPKDDDASRVSYTWDELQNDPDLRKLEFDTSMKRKNNILLPQRISQAVTALGWTFVIGGFVLNSVGFAWVKDPSGGIKVGTLDERDFQREVVRERRRDVEAEKKKNSPVSVSGMRNVNEHQLVDWMEQEQNS